MRSLYELPNVRDASFDHVINAVQVCFALADDAVESHKQHLRRLIDKVDDDMPRPLTQPTASQKVEAIMRRALFKAAATELDMKGVLHYTSRKLKKAAAKEAVEREDQEGSAEGGVHGTGRRGGLHGGVRGEW